MQSNLPIPAWSQRDPRWAKQRLGTANGTTIGGQGCLITSISMMNAGFDPGNQLAPNQVDDLFTDHGGYANQNLVIWNKINQLLANCSTQGQIFCQNTAAPVGDIKAHLDAGQLAILQVGFGGNPNNMHFVLALGYNGDDIVFNDPWYGDRASFRSGRYGSGASDRDILAVHYFADGIPPVKPEAPVAKPAAEQPLLGFQRVIIPTANCNYRSEPKVADNIIKKFDKGLTLDFKGYTHGQNIEGNDLWFVGRYSDGYAWSGCFTDTDVHDLPDLTPQPPAAEPTPAPVEPEAPAEPVVPAEEPTIPPVDEPVETVEKDWEQTWTPDTTIPTKVVSNPQGTDVIDVTTGDVVKHLPFNELVAALGGHFRSQNVHYFRTQSAVDKDLWNGVKAEDVSDYTPDAPQPVPETAPELDPEPEPEVPAPGTVIQPTKPPINPGAPVDAIQPPTSQPAGSVFDDDDIDWPGELVNANDEPRIPLNDILKSIRDVGLGILLSPARLFGWINKLVKGVSSWKS